MLALVNDGVRWQKRLYRSSVSVLITPFRYPRAGPLSAMWFQSSVVLVLLNLLGLVLL